MLERFLETDTLLTNVLPNLPLPLGGGLTTLSLLFHPDIVVLGQKKHTAPRVVMLAFLPLVAGFTRVYLDTECRSTRCKPPIAST